MWEKKGSTIPLTSKIIDGVHQIQNDIHFPIVTCLWIKLKLERTFAWFFLTFYKYDLFILKKNFF